MGSGEANGDSYGEARRAFREAAARRGWELSSHPIDRQGPDGTPLTIDAAVSPGPGSADCLIVSSGLHGVEGLLGSMVQRAFLDRSTTLPNVRVVFLHALNPFGFAWSRRFDEENVDLNRNFLLDGEAFAGSPPGYGDLDDLLNPRRPPGADAFVLRAWARVLRHGLTALKGAVVVGQYEFPRGLFFGGHGPSRIQAILRDELPRWVGPAGRVVHLDFHSGLGRWRTAKLLIDQPLTARDAAWLDRQFGPARWESSDTAGGVAYRARGSLGPWCRERLAGRSYLGLCAEFGTYGPIRVLAGLRAENQAHHWADPAAPATRRAAARLRELFVPASPSWRRFAVRGGLDLIERAGAGLGDRPGTLRL